jgi:outer membrane protein W
MSKFNYAILIGTFCVLAGSTNAQKITEPMVFSIQVGNAIAGGVHPPGDTIREPMDTRKLSSVIQRKPVLNLSFDYLFTNRFSVGCLFAFHTIDVTTKDSNHMPFEKGTVGRLYLGFRGLWHYGKNEKIDIYSGFKIGRVQFSTSNIEAVHTTSEQSELFANNNRSRLAVGFVPIGARFFVMNKFGINLETSIGAPTYLSAGINYRF